MRIIQSSSLCISIYTHTVMKTTILQLVAIYFGILEGGRDLVPLPKLPHIFYSQYVLWTT